MCLPISPPGLKLYCAFKLSFLTLKSPRMRAFVEAKQAVLLQMKAIVRKMLAAFFGALAGVLFAASCNTAL
jgi:hypothetical protein